MLAPGRSLATFCFIRAKFAGEASTSRPFQRWHVCSMSVFENVTPSYPPISTYVPAFLLRKKVLKTMPSSPPCDLEAWQPAVAAFVLVTAFVHGIV